MIYSAPVETEITEFVSKENKFRIKFPGVPKLDSKQSDEAKVSIFSVTRKGSNSVVAVWEPAIDINQNRDEIINRYRQNILNIPEPFKGSKINSPKIIEENEIQVGKYKGVEFKYEANLKFSVTRILFVGKRIYEINTDVTNWHILTKYHQDKVSDFNKETERFFKSFELLE